MVEYDELRGRIAAMEAPLGELRSAVDMDAIAAELGELEQQTAAEGFWNDAEASQKIFQRISSLKQKRDGILSLQTQYEDLQTLLELAEEAEDLSLQPEITAAADALERDITAQTLQTLLSGEYDRSNAILTLHAGAGGTEAQDWVEMLYRMYMRWAESHRYKFTQLDYLPGDEAGIKSVSFLIAGENAYGYLKGEAGVHRLVRVSPFDSSGRRHTSFASLEVIPEIDDSIQVDIRDEDIRIDTYRASGAGGQHVNKTSSAVRLIHLPTGVVVSCQTERSQFQNKDNCMKMLRAKLVELQMQEKAEKISDLKGVQLKIEWGSQIRSYVFMPYTLVKDTRTGYETSNVNAVMDGDLDGFINAYLTAMATGNWATK